MSDIPNSPSNAAGEQAMEAISAALAAQDLGRAAELAEGAIAQGWSNPLLFNLAAYRRESQRDFVGAAAILDRGLQAFPNDLELLTSLGLCLNRIGRPERALAAFDSVLLGAPDFLPAHQGKGEALERLGDLDGAERHYRAAVEGMADYADALAALALLLARTGRTEEAGPLAQRALDLDPRRSGARMALAYAALAAGDAAGAEAAARAVMTDAAADAEDQAVAASTLGDALDAQARFDEAFQAYATGLERLRALHATLPGSETGDYAANAQRQIDWFAKATSGAWAPHVSDADSPAAAHVFVLASAVGSGRDALVNVLAANPGVVVAERGGLAQAEAAYLMPADGLDRLAKLSTDDAKRLRDAYWKHVAEAGGDLRGKVVVDRAPTGAVALGLIAALFPQAKVIVALRDPRDMVLTAVRRPAHAHAELHDYQSLEGSGRLFDLSMRLLETSWERLPLEIAEARQEDMIANAEAETRSLCAFLGLEWTDAMTKAVVEGGVGSRGAYLSSRWRSYAAQLAPVLPVLKPWVERFGYPEA
jgi:tetratricopeptide (TPR) repeat protein